MRKTIFSLSVFALFITIIYSGCRKDSPVVDYGHCGYPKEIATIIETKCAVSGCHNSQSKDACAGLDLSTWDKMMDGDRNGAVCIPYTHDYSTMFLFTNTYADLGNIVPPTMPLNSDPLTHEQEVTLRNWIDAGAPDATGFVKWSDNPQRKKFYVTNQGCDIVYVFDAATRLQMRVVPVGADPSFTEGPHNIKISPDGQYWYTCFIAGLYLEKHRTTDDAFIGRALLGYNTSDATGSWNTLTISPDNHLAEVVDWSPQGSVAFINTQTMTLMPYGHVQGAGLFTQPHGSAIRRNATNDTTFFYATCNAGNFIYKMDTFPNLHFFGDNNSIPVDGSGVANTATGWNHDILFSPDGSKYYVTSQLDNTVQVMDANTDQHIATIPVGVYPQELAVSATMPYLYVTCTEDTLTYPGFRGSVYIINTQTNSVIGHVNPGWQPHGIAVDDDDKIVIVANRNINPGGPAPHHTTVCGGRNGYVSFIDMNTNQMMVGDKSRIEVAADPYSCAYRH